MTSGNSFDPERISDKINNYFEKQRSPGVHPNNRASEIGDECMRRLVFKMTSTMEAIPHPVSLLKRFRRGRALEPDGVRMLEDIGFKVLKREETFEDRELKLSGSRDGQLVDESGETANLEIKSIIQFEFAKLRHDQEYLLSSWLKKYYTQAQIYMHYFKENKCVFFFLENGGWSDYLPITVSYDKEHVEWAQGRAREINKHVEKGTYPEGVNDVKICPPCQFYHLCKPELVRDEIKSIDDPAWEAILDRLEELEESYKEYKEIEKNLKESLKNGDNREYLCGGHLITVKKGKSTSYELPKEVKEKYKKEGVRYTVKIDHLGDL